MTIAADLLERCWTLGIDLTRGADGTLVWETDTDSDPPADLLAEMSRHKAELLEMVVSRDGLSPSPPTSPPSPAPGDQATADAILSECLALLDRALEPGGCADNPVRRRLVEMYREIITRWHTTRDYALWGAVADVKRVLARWQEPPAKEGDARPSIPPQR